MHTQRTHTQKHQQPNSGRSGLAAVEFAVVLPMFLMLLLGLIEIGRGFETANTLELAIREGGRLASMEWDGIVPRESNPNAKVIQDIRSFLIANGLPAQNATIEITHAEGDAQGSEFILYDEDNVGKLFRISVSLAYSEVTAFPINYLEGRNIYADVVFRAGDVQVWR